MAPLTLPRHLCGLALVVGMTGCRMGYDFFDADTLGVGGLGSGASGSTATGGVAGAGPDGSGGTSNGTGGSTAGSNTGGSGGGVGGSTGGTGGSTGGTGGSTGGTGGSTGGTGGSGGTPAPGAPVAQFVATPSLGTTDTVFAFDANGSSDGEDSFDLLTFEWDFGDTSTATGATPTHSYASAGDYTVTLVVTDTDGLEDSYSTAVHVVSSGDLLDVTTGLDENDSGASVQNPGGSGLSLREALIISNDTPGRQIIQLGGGTFAAPTSNLPQVNDPVDIIGDGTGGIDGSSVGATRNCLQVFAGDTRLVGLEVFNCPRNGFQITQGDNVEVSDCYIHDVGQYGVFVGTSSNHRLLRNRIERTQYGLHVGAPSTLVENNEVRDSDGFGIFTASAAPDVTLVGNLVVGSSSGVEIGGANTLFAHNTIVNSAEWGAIVLDSGTRFLNNIIAYSGREAINGHFSFFAELDHGIFYNNTDGICVQCNPGPNTSTEDPLFVNEGSGDYRLQSSSPGVDAGVDLGFDRNGASAGNFSGTAPDYGYHEQ